ncbi:hypothetical protein E2C01_017466 [Portunus trituberculatus]|uniref:Uncharacterized protein n=1 Tax=Portunus trituberculatus TaxID=210409 RepID=A0A5B7DSY2_PORTR|nr:hypothetical protein [Portunus trituberculatus]
MMMRGPGINNVRQITRQRCSKIQQLILRKQSLVLIALSLIEYLVALTDAREERKATFEGMLRRCNGHVICNEATEGLLTIAGPVVAVVVVVVVVVEVVVVVVVESSTFFLFLFFLLFLSFIPRI